MERLADRETRLRNMTSEERADYEKAAQRWLEENREAIESSNRWVEENGLPLAKYRQFS